MLKASATNDELAKAYNTKKPVLIYDTDKQAHWAKITETVTQETDPDTLELIDVYTYSYTYLENIASLVDTNGNPRFIEGNGTPAEIEGFEATYCKWSLSGTHLMLVLAGTIANGTAIEDGTNISSYALPEFIMNKIYPVQGNILESKGVSLRDSGWGQQTLSGALRKATTMQIQFSAITLTADRSFRVQFDLLIDTD